MGRSVSVRASYKDDASFLIRLEKAVLADPRQDPSWREETALMIRALTIRFLEVADLAPIDTIDPGDEPEAEKK